ncbi:hypothetical protein [Nocardia pseudovaccinii]|uniref:hypothetical protein n=1 Tax=Nocardia pseudovaccinii TaxID=189540 RepID=UPI0007A4FE54|nr:hypothetical protein [Nocardia pseudovaccinii]
MKIHRSAWTAAITVAAVATGMATASAEPEPTAPPVTYRANVVDKSVIATLEGGVFTLAKDTLSVSVLDSLGHVLDAMPLSYRIDGQTLPIRSEISSDGRTLTLTPDTDGIRRDALQPVASPLENQLAMNDLINSVSIGTSLGSLVGTAIGAIAGIGVGFVIAGAACAVIALACVVTVLPIVALVGAVGGLAGAVLAGGPTAAYALYEYVTAMRAEPGQTKYAPQVQGKPGGIPAPAAAPQEQ